MRVELTKECYMEAAHKNERGLHGHSYRIELVAEGEVDPDVGWLVDYGDIKRAFEPLYAQLDHAYLNDVAGMTDTSTEGVRAWILERLKPALPCVTDVRVSIVGERAFHPVELAADPARNLPRRLRFSFDAAQSLPNLPERHPCRRLHGHTYRVEVGAEDFDGLVEPLRKLHESLDHRYLNEVPGLDAATSERLCRWIWNGLRQKVQGLTIVVIQETATARCAYYGD
jgi:6-pyruvoyltetrahydropterin/6-carboxytetrahydropterin synthase